ncbi:MAG: MFS transporter [Phycisphaerales bacterium]
MPLGRVSSALGETLAGAMPSRQPTLVRHNYERELWSVGLLGCATACVEGGVVGVIAHKAFDASDLDVAIITAAPAVSNLTAVLWTRLIHGRDRVRAVNVFQIAVLVCVAVMGCGALVPREIGLWLLVCGCVLARCFLTGMIAARTDLWRGNYPRERRARTIGHVTLLASLVVGLTAVATGWAMDATPMGFAWVYGFSVVMGALGVRVFARIRWRGRGVQLAEERRGVREEKGAPPSLAAMTEVLKNDPMYRRFMAAQFMLGMPQLAAIPVFIIAIKDYFDLAYTGSMLLTQALPVIVPVLVIPLWAPLLDRLHIVKFRAWHSWVFVLANLLMFLAFWLKNEPLLYLSRVMLGIATGGGMLAWELGHHDFARRDQAAIYMGVHVFLTGVRGVFSPFLGTMLYAGGAVVLGATTLSVPALGAWTFLVLAAMSAMAGLMFISMARAMRRS